MCVKNNKVLKTTNSQEFIVERFSETEIILTNAVEPDSENITVDIKIFHNNFVANYAATTHKSQGATITKSIVLFDWTRMLDDVRIGYTAVSRGKNCEQIRICREIIV
jgi:ATP-dependent exoDNAse (exonuclease V) alpha subunit